MYQVYVNGCGGIGNMYTRRVRFSLRINHMLKKYDAKIVIEERKRNFEISRTDRFLYRTRYFTDSGIIGSREFVSGTYQQFKHLFQSKHEKKPKPVKGLDGLFSLKRLSEMI